MTTQGSAADISSSSQIVLDTLWQIMRRIEGIESAMARPECATLAGYVELVAFTGISEPTLRKAPDFPKSIRSSGDKGKHLWLKADVTAWLSARREEVAP